MAYDRYDSRDDRSRWANERSNNDRDSDRRGRHERGFFERAGDEIASWFGDDDGDRSRRDPRGRDPRPTESSDYDRGYGRDYDRDRSQANEERGLFNRGGSSERDHNPDWRRETSGNRDRNYRPMTGDYGRSTHHESDQFFAASGVGRGERDYDRSQSPWGRDDYLRTSRAGSSDMSDRSRHEDPHYRSWRERHVSELDRDYDDYRREHQSKFESDFGSWREKRQQKRAMLGQIREHMEVVGNDDEHVGTIDRVAGDRVILAKSDPESGGAHHSLSCSDIDRVEGQKVILGCSAEDAKNRLRDDSRSRALFEREDQGEMGPRTLNRSFEGTYR